MWSSCGGIRLLLGPSEECLSKNVSWDILERTLILSMINQSSSESFQGCSMPTVLHGNALGGQCVQLHSEQRGAPDQAGVLCVPHSSARISDSNCMRPMHRLVISLFFITHLSLISLVYASKIFKAWHFSYHFISFPVIFSSSAEPPSANESCRGSSHF